MTASQVTGDLYEWFYDKPSLAATTPPSTLTPLTAPTPPVYAVPGGTGTYRYTLTGSFHVGQDGYHWNQESCTIDHEAENGIGLPGHHSCRDKSIPANAKYLGKVQRDRSLYQLHYRPSSMGDYPAHPLTREPPTAYQGEGHWLSGISARIWPERELRRRVVV